MGERTEGITFGNVVHRFDGVFSELIELFLVIDQRENSDHVLDNFDNLIVLIFYKTQSNPISKTSNIPYRRIISIAN